MKYVKHSFYRYIGYFLAFLFISYVLSFILNFLGIKPKNLLLDNAYALDTNSWYTDDLFLSNVYVTNGLNGSSVGTITNSSIPGTDHRNMIKISQTTTNYHFVFNIPQLNANYSYLIQLYMCGPATQTFNLSNYYFGNSYNNLSAYNINSASWTNLGKPTPNSTDSNCRMLQIQVTPNTRFNYIGLRNTGTYNDSLNFYGIKLYSLGISGSLFESVTSDLLNSQSVITNNANSNKNLIINNANSNQQLITNNNTSNTNRLISNNNSNWNSAINTINSNQNQTNQGLSNINSNITETNDLIKDDNIDNSSGNDFFDSISTNQHGITSIITAPLSFIQSFATESCSPISASVFGQDFTIPCMKQKEIAFLGQDFYNIIVILVNGPLVYAIATYFVKSVKRAQDPDDDRIEVVEL